MAVTYHIGEMKQVVAFLENNPTDSTTGGAYDHYTTLLTTRGRLRKSSGSRSLSFGEILNQEQYELICRFQTALVIRIDMKVGIDGGVYTISSWEKIDERRFYYRFKLNLDA